MIVCWYTRRDLTALADGELTRKRAERVCRHIAECAACATLAAELRATSGRMREESGPLPDLDGDRLFRSVVARLQDEPTTEPRRWFVPWPWASALAAAGVAVILLVRVQPVPGPSGEGLRAAAKPHTAEAPALRDERQGVASAPLPKVVTADPQAEPDDAPGDVAAAQADDPLDGLPAEVLARPDLFRNYRFFEQLDAMEHFESVRHLDPWRDTPAQPQG